MTLTDDQIDRLSGVELGIAAAEAAGWKRVRPGVHSPDRLFGDDHEGDRASLPCFHTDKGAALDLLLNCVVRGWNVSDDMQDGDVCVWLSHTAQGYTVLATGPIADCASVMCRAFLKLATRKGE